MKRTLLLLITLTLFSHAATLSAIKPPKTINVCGKNITIALVSSLGTNEYGAPVIGYYDSKDTIFLDYTRPIGEQGVTLSHEIMHVILTTNVSSDKTTYHDFINKLAPCYVDTIFHSNPDLLVFLIAASYKLDLAPEDKLLPLSSSKHK